MIEVGIVIDSEPFERYFQKLGFSREVAKICGSLYACGPQTISEVAEHTSIERTRIYRFLGEMKASKLIEIETQYKRSILHAAPISNLELTLIKKDQELRNLKGEFNELRQMLSGDRLSSPTRVQTYQGEEGLKQMFWNQTRSKTENLSILHENIQQRTNSAFFDRWVRVCNERGLQFRSIISDNFIENQEAWYRYHANERLQDWSGRRVPEKVFTIVHSVVIYNDVTAYYSWNDSRVSGIEIYNQQIASVERQFFEMLWRLGTAFDDTRVEKLRQTLLKTS